MRRYAGYFAIIFFILFALVATFVSANAGWVGMFDTMVRANLAAWQTPGTIYAFEIVTFLGGPIGVVCGTTMVMWFFRHRPDIVARLLVAIIGQSVVVEYLKNFFHRLRPDALPGYDQIASFSFPSGHATATMVLYGFLALLLYVHARTRMQKALSLIAPACFILLVGFSRIILNYHYPTDVLAGYLLGAFWLMFVLALPLNHHLYHDEAIDPTVL